LEEALFRVLSGLSAETNQDEITATISNFIIGTPIIKIIGSTQLTWRAKSMSQVD
jgi:hypothetical protein